MKVVIVESPAKAKTINRYLGPDYEVFASFGHVRDLPSKDGSVKPDEDFEMVWEVDSAAKKRLAEIARAVKDADELILATDPDREGEAISWHVLNVLRSKKVLNGKPVRRVVFNAVTKSAVQEAMAHPREIDEPLVDAYLARRALDYLVGFSLSPILWRKLPGSRSAGRVQSVALRLVSEREADIERFKPTEYWSVTASLEQAGMGFEARAFALDGKKLDRLDIANEADATAIRDAVKAGRLQVTSVEKKPQKRNPYAPFTTSTLQQDASNRLGFSPSRTMQVAQRLYEGVTVGGESVGLITYMRTDAVQMAPEAIDAARRQIAGQFGDHYLPDKPRLYQTKAKNAQEAHEAIRPTDLSRRPETLPQLESEQLRLYELIWKRALASQMRAAEIERTTVDLDVAGADRPMTLRATGSVTTFEGFLALYAVPTSDKDEESRDLPALAEGDTPALVDCVAEQHFTQPPPRYTEASLIRRMEELGIGRPSTYASTLAVLKDRDYVRLEKKALVPEDRGHPLRRIRFHGQSRGRARRDFRRQDRVEGRASAVLDRFLRPHRRNPGSAGLRGAGRAQRAARRSHFPGPRGRRRPAHLSQLRRRKAVAQGRALRRLHRLLELPRMQLHKAACRRRQGRRRRRRPQGARRRSGDLPAGHPAHRPLRALRAAR